MESNAFPYRAPGERPPPSVIDFRLLSPWWPVVLASIFMALLIGTSHRVELTCARAGGGTGTCEARDLHVAWSSDPVTVRVELLQGAKIAHTPKHGSSVALVTKQGSVFLSSTTEGDFEDDKGAMVSAVQRFVADRSATRIDAAYGSRWANNAWGLLFLLPFVLIPAILARRVRVIVDRADGMVTLTRSRFPLPPRVEAWGLEEVTGADVEQSTGSKGGAIYRVALILRGGERVPLTRSHSSGRAEKEIVAAAIRQALSDAG